MKSRKPGGDALEKIMRDVLKARQVFTHQAGLASRKNGEKTGHPKDKPSARVVYFPRRFRAE
jgi:hypothetical protein